MQLEVASACEKPAHEHVDTQIVIIGQPRDSRKRVEVYSTTCNIQTRATQKHIVNHNICDKCTVRFNTKPNLSQIDSPQPQGGRTFLPVSTKIPSKPWNQGTSLMPHSYIAIGISYWFMSLVTSMCICECTIISSEYCPQGWRSQTGGSATSFEGWTAEQKRGRRS